MRSTGDLGWVWVQFASGHKSVGKCGGYCGGAIELQCNGSRSFLALCHLEKRQQVAGVHSDECRISRDAEMCRIYHWEIFVACESPRGQS